MIELLAPAKDKICAKAAIDYGADAIYIGAGEFGAREKASNSIEDIKEIVEYAHKFNVRIYVTLNTILDDKEVLKAKELAKKLAQINVDAIIIQDMGLFDLCWGDKDFSAEYLKHIFPHASTQCDNRTIEKVKFLENIGFKRVVLARELSIEQIKEIKKQTNVELEVFIHGALCVSYSGQCYLSYAIGGRSANRGECAQPCRKKYTIIDEDGKIIAKNTHALCLKDFNASKYIHELADAGVTSFKIEGRLKDVNYVKNVVSYYRKLIDGLGLQKASSGQVFLDFEPNLSKSFNRGFTSYFLKNREKCFTFDSPKSKGEYIGKVSKVGKDYFEISNNLALNNQDGLCFFIGDNLSGFLVNKVEKNKIYPNKMGEIKVGTEIYRNFDAEFEKKLKNSKTCRKIGVKIEFNLNSIKAIDEDNVCAEVKYEFEEFAQNKEKMVVNITTQFKKSGDTEFLVEEVKINTDKLPFLPVSKLNELRRELLEKLTNERMNIFGNKDEISIEKTQATMSNLRIDYRGNISNKYAKDFYEKLGFEVVEPALESGLNCKGKTVMTTKHCLKYAFDMCKSSKKLYLVDEKNKKYELKFNCDKCEMEIVF